MGRLRPRCRPCSLLTTGAARMLCQRPALHSCSSLPWDCTAPSAPTLLSKRVHKATTEAQHHTKSGGRRKRRQQKEKGARKEKGTRPPLAAIQRGAPQLHVRRLPLHRHQSSAGGAHEAGPLFRRRQLAQPAGLVGRPPRPAATLDFHARRAAGLLLLLMLLSLLPLDVLPLLLLHRWLQVLIVHLRLPWRRHPLQADQRQQASQFVGRRRGGAARSQRLLHSAAREGAEMGRTCDPSKHSLSTDLIRGKPALLAGERRGELERTSLSTRQPGAPGQPPAAPLPRPACHEGGEVTLIMARSRCTRECMRCKAAMSRGEQRQAGGGGGGIQAPDAPETFGLRPVLTLSACRGFSCATRAWARCSASAISEADKEGPRPFGSPGRDMES